MASLQIGSNEKLEVLADLIYPRQALAGRCRTTVALFGFSSRSDTKRRGCSSFPRRGIIERWHIWVQRTEENRPKIRTQEQLSSPHLIGPLAHLNWPTCTSPDVSIRDGQEAKGGTI